MNYEMCNRQMMTVLRIFQQAKQGRETKIFFVEVQEGETCPESRECHHTETQKHILLVVSFPSSSGWGSIFLSTPPKNDKLKGTEFSTVY
jgi:hypothetical protein